MKICGGTIKNAPETGTSGGRRCAIRSQFIAANAFIAANVLIAANSWAAQRLSAAMEDVLGAAGSFVAMNNRVSQSVPHLHTHVVPRNRKDGLRGFFWPRTTYADDADAAAMATRLRTSLT